MKVAVLCFKYHPCRSSCQLFIVSVSMLRLIAILYIEVDCGFPPIFLILLVPALLPTKLKIVSLLATYIHRELEMSLHNVFNRVTDGCVHKAGMQAELKIGWLPQWLPILEENLYNLNIVAEAWMWFIRSKEASLIPLVCVKANQRYDEDLHFNTEIAEKLSCTEMNAGLYEGVSLPFKLKTKFALLYMTVVVDFTRIRLLPPWLFPSHLLDGADVSLKFYNNLNVMGTVIIAIKKAVIPGALKSWSLKRWQRSPSVCCCCHFSWLCLLSHFSSPPNRCL